MTYSESKNSVNEEIEQVATEDTNKSEESTEQIIDNEGGTEQPEELNVPESISVQSLDEALQISVANGDENATSTDRVKYVDVNGNSIENAPTTIELGTIPPPRTRLSSAFFVTIRGVSFVEIASISCGLTFVPEKVTRGAV